jgi:hypothetical protein
MQRMLGTSLVMIRFSALATEVLGGATILYRGYIYEDSELKSGYFFAELTLISLECLNVVPDNNILNFFDLLSTLKFFCPSSLRTIAKTVCFGLCSNLAKVHHDIFILKSMVSFSLLPLVELLVLANRLLSSYLSFLSLFPFPFPFLCAAVHLNPLTRLSADMLNSNQAHKYSVPSRSVLSRH